MAEVKNKTKYQLVGDRKYFAQIPNYIPDHSTANELALYVHIKKIAGENGECFATEQTLMKKLGKGKKAFDKAVKYLISQDWITFSGKTRGKTRPINTYQINDIWEMNNNYYEKINAKSNISNISTKDKSQKFEDIFQKQYNISSRSNVEEEPSLIRTKEEEILAFQEKQEKVKQRKREIRKIMDSIKDG